MYSTEIMGFAKLVRTSLTQDHLSVPAIDLLQFNESQPSAQVRRLMAQHHSLPALVAWPCHCVNKSVLSHFSHLFALF
jgi:hypothetical protein